MLLNRHSCFLFVVKFVFLVDFKHIANTQNKMSSLLVMTMVSAVVVFYFGEFQTHRIYGAGMVNLFRDLKAFKDADSCTDKGKRLKSFIKG